MKTLIAGITLGVVLLVLNGDFTSAQQAPSTVGKAGQLQWDAPTTNEDGTPLDDLAGYTLGAFATGQDPNAGAEPIASVETTETTAAISPMLPTLSPGSVDFWVSATDTSGNRSVWEGPLSLTVDPTSPGMPSSLRVTVNVTVTVGQ